jgi:hypothetical protein
MPLDRMHQNTVVDVVEGDLYYLEHIHDDDSAQGQHRQDKMWSRLRRSIDVEWASGCVSVSFATTRPSAGSRKRPDVSELP